MADQNIAFKVTADSAAADASVKGFKTQLREATADLVAMSVKFGDTSKEAATAAKKVAGLKDAIGDAKALAETFNPDKKFVALGGALQGVVGGFSAAQGAMGLFGNQSKDVEQALLKVQSVMALQQGISGVFGAVDSFKLLYAEIIKSSGAQKIYALATTLAATVQKAFGISVVTTSNSFKVLRGAIISTGIGALVVAVGFLVDKIMNWANSASAAEKAQLRLAAATAKTNDAIGNEIRVLQALGGKEAEINQKKIQQTENELTVLRKKYADNKGLNDEDMKQFQKLRTDKRVLNIEEENRLKKVADEKIKQDDKVLEKEIKTGEASVKINKKNNDSIQKANEDAADKKAAAAKEAADKLKEIEQNRIEQQNTTDEMILQNSLNQIKDDFTRKQQEIANNSQKQIDAEALLLDKGLINKQTYAQRVKLIEDNAAIEQGALIDANNQKRADKELASQRALNDAKLIEAERVNQVLGIDTPEVASIKIATLEQAKLDAEILAFQAAKANKELSLGELALLEQNHETKVTSIKDEAATAQIAIEEKKENARRALAQQSAQALAALSDVIGKETAAGKALAVSAALINTYLGITAGVKLGFPMAIPAVVIAAATGFGAVKNILATKVPGKGASGSMPNAPSMATAPSMPTAPIAPQATTTTLDQNSINGIGAASSRAFVLETDVTNNQERIARLNRAARIN